MKILAGSSNPELSGRLSDELGIDLLDREVMRFPDGELYARIDDVVKGETVLLVQSTYPDHNAMEFLILSRLLKDLGAYRITGIIPYFGYARQDRIFREGESFTARTMASLIEMSADDVICVNLHKEATLREFRKVGKSANVSVMADIGDFLSGFGIEYILAPDKGAVDYAREAAESCGCGFDHLEKTRIDGSTVKIAPKDLEVDGKTVCIVDDIIATGGTIMKAATALREQGAKAVYACCAHGLYTGGGMERLKPVLDGLYSSDSIENPTSGYSAARAISKAVKEMEGELDG
ncbi:MAG: ribose-phosphate diphosphokinase [Thermoplasmatota archaeon]